MRRRKERPIPSWGSIVGAAFWGLLMIFNVCMSFSRLRQDDPSWYALVCLTGFGVGCYDLISCLRAAVRKWKSRSKIT